MSRVFSKEPTNSAFPENTGERTLYVGRDRPIRISSGHRIQHHEGKCSRPHGHNYEISVSVTGELTEEGWVVDKGDVTGIIDEWDHRFLLEADDPLRTRPGRTHPSQTNGLDEGSPGGGQNRTLPREEPLSPDPLPSLQ